MAERYYWHGDGSHNSVGLMIELSGDEAHHLVRVMRQKPGDKVTLFDGNGREFLAEIMDTRKDRVSLRILEVRDIDNEPRCQVTVAASLPKGDRQKWLIEKLTELGCYRLIPLQTERNIAQCSGQVIERLRRQVLESTKQCNRTRLMQIEPEMTIADCVGWAHSEGMSDGSGEKVGWIAHPRSDGDFGQSNLADLLQTLMSSKAEQRKRMLSLIGPVGGFTRQEVELAVSLGMKPLDLGARILRVETAAILLTAILTATP